MKACNILGLAFLSAISLSVAAPAAFADPPASGNWSVSPTFVDDFNGAALDTTKWSTGYRWSGVINSEWQGYVPENVTVANGVCTIKAEKRTVQNTDMTGYKGQSMSYASGAIQTYNKWTQKYGYFEVRAKLPSGKGTWPAFWMLPDRGATYTNLDQRVVVGNTIGGVSVPMGNEIDIFEIMGSWKDSSGISKSHSGFIYGYAGGQSKSGYALDNNGAGPGQFALVDPDTQFHTYGVAWGPGQLDYYIDGIKVLGFEEPTSMTNISITPEYLILNVAIKNDDWTGTPVPTADIDAGLPCSMTIDYVKAWSGTPAPAPAPVASGTYRITPKSDASKALEVFGAGMADSDNVEISNYTGASNQQWNLNYLGGAVYEINAVHSGKALNLAGGSGSDYTNVDQSTDTDAIGQRWKLEPSGTAAYYRLTPLVNTVRGLTTYGTANNTNAYIFWYASMDGQKWKFEPVNTVPAGTEIIVDNAAATGVTVTGTWSTSTASTGQYYGSNYLHDGNTGKGSKTVKFTPSLPVAGTYKVYAMWNNAAGMRATSVPITTTYAGGSDTVMKDQNTNGGIWTLLGTYSFAAGTGGNVVISNNGTNNYVIADAVKFVLQ